MASDMSTATVLATIRRTAALRPSARLAALWLINLATLAGSAWEAPAPVLCGATAMLVLAASFIHWRYRRIMVPARAVAAAWCLGQTPLGEAARDLSEAVYRWDGGRS